MISCETSDGIIHTPDHSFTWDTDNLYVTKEPYGSSGSIWRDHFYDGFMPRVHLAKNPNNAYALCYLPSSLLSTLSGESSITTKPSTPKFQCVRNTRIATNDGTGNYSQGQCYVRFYVDSSQYNMAFTNGEFSSHLYCAQTYSSDSGNYFGHIQPIGFTNDASVLVNLNDTYMSAGYNIVGLGDHFNKNMSAYTNLRGDYVNKVLLNFPRGTSTPPERSYYASVNFLISIQTDNYDFQAANKTVEIFGISIPFNYVRFSSSSNPSWTYRFLDVIDNHNRIGPAYSDHRLIELDDSKCSFIRGRRSDASGYTPNFDYYVRYRNESDGTQHVLIHGCYTFKVRAGYPGTGCPVGDEVLAVGSPIVSFWLTEYYLKNRSNKFVNLIMSCAENFEIWT